MAGNSYKNALKNCLGSNRKRRGLLFNGGSASGFKALSPHIFLPVSQNLVNWVKMGNVIKGKGWRGGGIKYLPFHF
jgi:hypothetical protein